MGVDQTPLRSGLSTVQSRRWACGDFRLTAAISYLKSRATKTPAPLTSKLGNNFRELLNHGHDNFRLAPILHTHTDITAIDAHISV